MAKPTEDELVKALDDLWTRLKDFIPEDEQEQIMKKHWVVIELDECGPNGPVGIGLGRYGGHAVGED